MVDSNESNVISNTINHVSCCEKWRLQYIYIYIYFVYNNSFIDRKKEYIYIYIYICGSTFSSNAFFQIGNIGKEASLFLFFKAWNMQLTKTWG